MELFETVEIYKIPDEITGMALSSFLADAGVEASVQPMEASFYGGALNVMLGYWGKLLVPRDQEVKARKQLEIFLREFHGR
jgi:membrane protein YqaA with SNARE-associated domain